MRSSLARRLAPLRLLLLSLPACGIDFVASEEGTELIDKVEIAGDFVAGGEVTVTMTINQAYPVPVHIACYVENQDLVTEDQEDVVFHERATLVGEEFLDTAISPDRPLNPDDEVEKLKFSYPFRVDQQGTYFIACITPAAPDNGIGRSFTVRAR
jgi:ABC-type transporter Mla maintaining outer membrane lipid asymmetry ATPase subunit MlaF